MDKKNQNQKGQGWAFLPIIAFVVIYMGAGIIYQIQGVEFAFYQFPSFGAMFIAVVIAFLLGKERLDDKFSIFARGIGNEGVITMLMIYILAGAFSGVTMAMGGRDAAVNMGLSFIPVQFLAVGVFIIAAFMGTAAGTSIGTISAIAPVAIGIADKGGLNVAIIVGACVGGAMFGDNLSMISDTTIAATSTQGVGLKDKFKVNLMVALPAAVSTIILLLIFGRPKTVVPMDNLNFEFIKVLPYIIVFVLAIIGIHVFVVLVTGILSAVLIGVATGTFSVAAAATAMYSGVTGMDEIFYLTMIMAGVAALIQSRGGIAILLEKLSSVVKGAKSAQLIIAVLVSVLDVVTATNTVAIILSGDLAKNISHKYKVDPRRTASLLDIFSCVFQGLLPYSGQLLISASFAIAAGHSVNAIYFMPYVWYSYLLGLFGILSVFVPFADGAIRKRPLNWEESVH